MSFESCSSSVIAPSFDLNSSVSSSSSLSASNFNLPQKQENLSFSGLFEVVEPVPQSLVVGQSSSFDPPSFSKSD